MNKYLPRILLVDDDEALCCLLDEYLKAEGMDVTIAHDGEAGYHEALGGDLDLVVLDIMLPGISGIDVLREIRRRTDLPVVMLTARGDELDRILGLELGADDYLPKPCNPRELVAHIRAVLRRTLRTPVADLQPELPALPLTMSKARRMATWRGEPLHLTGTEFNLLAALFDNAGTVVSKNDLSMKVLGRPLSGYDRSLDMHVSNLRRKLGKLDDDRLPIETVHGSGIVLLKE